jgi:uncharacterized protein
MKLIIAIMAVGCLGAPVMAQVSATGTQKTPALHQPGTPAAKPGAASPSSEEKVDPAKETAIRHLMDITETSKLGDSISEYITNQVRSVMSRNLSADRLPKFMDTFNQRFAASSPSTAVSESLVGIYSRAFSMQDIQGLTTFYESPLGQKVVKTLPQVMQESQATGIQIEQNAAMKALETMQDDYPELKPMLEPRNAAPGAGPAPGAAPTPSPAPSPVTPPAPPK